MRINTPTPIKRILGFLLFTISQMLFFFVTIIIGATLYLINLILFNNSLASRICDKGRTFWGKSLFHILSFSKIVIHTELYNPQVTEGSLIILNHQHMLDIGTIFKLPAKFTQKFNFLMKIELLKIPIPFLVWSFKRTGEIFINRSNKKSSFEAMLKVIEYIKKKRNIVIFPEGTRNRKPDTLLPFKDGISFIAKKTQVQINPIVIYGTKLINGVNNERFFTWPRPIHCKFLKPITIENELHPANSSSKFSPKEKIEAIRSLMQDTYNQLKNLVETTS